MLAKILLLVVPFIPINANAAWTVEAQKPNMFGDTEFSAVNLSQTGRALAINCNQNNKLQIAFIERTFGNTETEEFPILLYIQIDGGRPESFSAGIKTWNDKFSGAVLEGRSAQTLRLARLLMTAQKSIAVGVRLGDQRMAESFDAGNQSAFRTAISASCRLDRNAPTP